MKSQFTLAQKLTGSIALVVIAQIALVSFLFLGHFEPLLEKQSHDVIEQGALASARTYADRWAKDVLRASHEATTDALDSELQQEIQQVLKEHRSASGIAIYKVNGDTAKKTATLKNRLQPLARETRYGAEFRGKLTKGDQLTKKTTYVSSDNAYARATIQMEGKSIGYLLYAQSIKGYHDELKNFKTGMAVVLFIFFLLQMVAVFLVGSKTGRPVALLAKTAAQIAAGDLTIEIRTPRSAATEVISLSHAIRQMAEAIHQQVSLIKTLTVKTSDVSKGVSRAMSHLAGSASEQAAAVSETAATVEQMEKSGKSVAEAVKRIVDAADRSAEASTRGRQAANTASGIIARIKEDAANISVQSRSLLSNVEEVGTIINSVNAIAEQSKILAVNASIEASKAGEYGTGFAVVAHEVKNLAGQSKEATEQITRALTSIRHSVEAMVRLSRDGEERTAQGVTAIANTGAIVNDLSDAIQEASDVANEIESSVNQQSVGLSQIASAMDEINISATENQEISQNMEKGTQEMTDALAELNVLVDVWNTIENTQLKN